MQACLEVDSVIKSFGERTVLADVYLSCVPGEVIGLFGRNGTGKSTLLKIIFGTMKSDRSFIRIDGSPCRGSAFRSGAVAYLPQHHFLPPGLALAEAAALYLPEEQRKLFFADRRLIRLRRSKVKELSGGELRYVEIKLILRSGARFVLLDEPFNGLSPLAAAAVRELIGEAAGTKGILLTDHNFREVHRCVNRILLLNDCYLKEIKDPQELIPYGYYEK